MLPKITVITPVYNGEKHLEEAINSLINQQYPNLEYIVIDAKSTDETPGIIKKYKDFINVIISEKDKGTNDACNKGFKIATGEIIGLLNADDRYENNVLHRVAEEFIRDKELDCVSCGAQIISKDIDGKYVQQKIFRGNDLELNLQSVLACPITDARFLKKSVIDKHNGYSALDKFGQYIIASDKEFFIRLALDKTKNKSFDEIGYTYLSHKNSQTFTNNNKNIARMRLEHMDMYERFLAEYHLKSHEKSIFKTHHRKESVRFAWMDIKHLNLKRAFTTAKRGIKINNLLWIIRFIFWPIQIGVKKISRIIRSKKNV